MLCVVTLRLFSVMVARPLMTSAVTVCAKLVPGSTLNVAVDAPPGREKVPAGVFGKGVGLTAAVIVTVCPNTGFAGETGVGFAALGAKEMVVGSLDTTWVKVAGALEGVGE